MNSKEFQAYQQRFISALRTVLSEHRKDAQLFEAGFPAYADPNFLARFLFWRRLWVAVNFLELQGPYEAILDFGCGSGVILPLLTGLANRVVGVDIDITPYRALSACFSFPDEIEIYETKERHFPVFPIILLM